MKQIFIFALALIFLSSCKKSVEAIGSSIIPKGGEVPLPAADGYVKYTIAKGEQYCDKNSYQTISLEKLAFSVKFDSSAIYQTTSPGNQNDINKLFGFSDNNEQHHKFSARFGWRWSNNALRLFGYIYNNGTMSAKELGTVAIGTENTCTIEVRKGAYVFTLNGKTESMPRASTTLKAEGYQLYPYFGGDELAPHTISIWIKKLPAA